ncbi:MAG: pentapeptide repeat-containing protein [Saprospiraceae bacterium]
MINKSRIQQLTLKNTPLSIQRITSIIDNHLIFLQNGGAGGKWKTIHIKGIVLALYFGTEVSKGTQANFELQRLPDGINLKEIILPFANFCSSKIEQVNFQSADLSYSIFTDVAAKNINFHKANLAYVDFTRANLENADFSKANLVGADFENCNLAGANFEGANLSGTRFPGANLMNVSI